MKYALVLAVITGPAAADPLAVLDAAVTIFPDQPQFTEFQTGDAPCGMGGNSNPYIGYCATQRVMYYRNDFADRPSAAYEMAHVMGHYYQIRYGVADVALRMIRARRENEDALRGMVTRQVECLAGVMMATADLPFVDLTDIFEGEPFTQAHWGRSPLNGGPRVSIGLAARADWYRTGYGAADVAACSVGEMSADLLVAAQR